MELPTIQTMIRAEIALAERFKIMQSPGVGRNRVGWSRSCAIHSGKLLFPEGCFVVTCIPLWFYDSPGAPAEDLLSE
jgi:hypothetical protein